MVSESARKPLQQILEVAKAISQGDFSKEVKIDTEGIIAELAKELNNTVQNLRIAIPSIAKTTDSTPDLASTAQSVADLMNDSTKSVLDSSDRIIIACEALEQTELNEHASVQVKLIKDLIMDIISAQSYQDKARQKLEKMEIDIKALRDSLLEALIVMNINVNKTPEHYQNKQNQLKEVQTNKNEEQKQDLVDQLLAEFGL